MANVIRSYTSISPDHFVKIAAVAGRALGMSIASDAGEASAHGVTLGWAYDTVALTLSFTLISKPFYVPVEVIQSHLNQLVNGAETNS